MGRNLTNSLRNGGEGGIRTHGRLSPTAVFKTAALNHSATSPRMKEGEPPLLQLRPIIERRRAVQGAG